MKYLEIDSSYRNRKLWPSPSNFDIPVSVNGRKNPKDASDPVSQTSTIVQWKCNAFNSIYSFSPQPFISPMNVAEIPVYLKTTKVEIIFDNIDIIYNSNSTFDITSEYDVKIDPELVGYTPYIETITQLTTPSPTTSTKTTKILTDNSNVQFQLITSGDNVCILEERISGGFYRNYINEYNEYLEYGEGYYNGCLVAINNNYYKILKWESLTETSIPPSTVIPEDNKIKYQVTFNNKVNENIGSIGVIIDSTNLNDLYNPVFFVPRGSSENNNYVNYYLVNENNGENNIIYYYDSVNRLVGLNLKKPLNEQWNKNCCFSIRKNAPKLYRTNNDNYLLKPRTVDIESPLSNVSFILDNSYNLGDVTNSFLEIRLVRFFLNDTRKIIKYYNIKDKIVGKEGTGYETNTIYIKTKLWNNTNLDNNYSNLQNNNISYFNGLYIKIISDIDNQDQIRLIVSHQIIKDKNDKPLYEKLILSDNVNLQFKTSFSINSGLLEKELSYNISGDDDIGDGFKFWILPTDFDNLNPFVQTQCIGDSNQLSCYKIDLIHLILPNQLINTYKGGRLSSHPFLYVSISNVSLGNFNKYILFSNNPNSSTAIFRIKIGDVTDIYLTNFVKFTGDGVRQTIKFKTDDTLHFSIFFPNGDLFKTTRYECFSPYEINQNIQISSLFGLERIK
jgi:hypothetical protein